MAYRCYATENIKSNNATSTPVARKKLIVGGTFLQLIQPTTKPPRYCFRIAQERTPSCQTAILLKKIKGMMSRLACLNEILATYE